MTDRDPYIRDPYSTRRPIREGWGTGAIVAAIVLAVVVIGAIAYGISDNSRTAGNNPTNYSSPPATTGLGGTPPRAPANPATPGEPGSPKQ